MTFSRRGLPYLAMILSAGCFMFLYASTFRDHAIVENRMARGPLEFEGKAYEDFAFRELSFSQVGHPKLTKHILCVFSYPIIQRGLSLVLPHAGMALVPAFLVGMGIALFGCWLYWRTRCFGVSFLTLLLMGFSFTTWFNGSVWESRAFIFLGAVFLLIALDRLLSRQCLLSLFYLIAASVVILLICLGNLYDLFLAPFAFFLVRTKIGLKKTLLWSGIYLISVLLGLAITYEGLGRINPGLRLFKGPRGGVIKFCRSQAQYKTRADWRRLGNIDSIQLNLAQAVVYSVGGVPLPGGVLIHDRVDLENEWRQKHGRINYAYLSYFQSWSGRLFIGGYVGLIIIALVVLIKKKLWFQESLLPLIVFWILLFVVFFIYICDDSSPPFAAELQPPLWAFFGLIFSRVKRRRIWAFLGVLSLVVFWNNWTVMSYFKQYYARFSSDSPPFVDDWHHAENIMTRPGVKLSEFPGSLDGGHPEHLLDQDISSDWSPATDSSFLLIDFGEDHPPIVQAMAARPQRGELEQFLFSATIWGSIDGEAWEEMGIITQKEVPNDHDWRVWSFQNRQAFRYYRITFAEPVGSRGSCCCLMTELALFD